jgi:hypothetical protein
MTNSTTMTASKLRRILKEADVCLMKVGTPFGVCLMKVGKTIQSSIRVAAKHLSK